MKFKIPRYLAFILGAFSLTVVLAACNENGVGSEIGSPNSSHAALNDMNDTEVLQSLTLKFPEGKISLDWLEIFDHYVMHWKFKCKDKHGHYDIDGDSKLAEFDHGSCKNLDEYKLSLDGVEVSSGFDPVKNTYKQYYNNSYKFRPIRVHFINLMKNPIYFADPNQGKIIGDGLAGAGNDSQAQFTLAKNALYAFTLPKRELAESIAPSFDVIVYSLSKGSTDKSLVINLTPLRFTLHDKLLNVSGKMDYSYPKKIYECIWSGHFTAGGRTMVLDKSPWGEALPGPYDTLRRQCDTVNTVRRSIDKVYYPELKVSVLNTIPYLSDEEVKTEIVKMVKDTGFQIEKWRFNQQSDVREFKQDPQSNNSQALEFSFKLGQGDQEQKVITRVLPSYSFSAPGENPEYNKYGALNIIFFNGQF